MLIREILRQRLQGTKNEKGVYVTPAFPKLIYVPVSYTHLRITGHSSVHDLSVEDLVTINREISEYTNISHA